MLRIGLGNPRRRRRIETFGDGAIEVHSRSGLRPAERAMMDALPQERSGRALVVGSVEAALGVALRALNPELAVTCHFHDAWDHDAAARSAGRRTRHRPELVLAPDLPDGPWDFLVLPTTRHGPTDLLLERVWHARELLRPGGLLLASTDNPRDRFLRGVVEKAFGALTARPDPRGDAVAYVARCPEEPPKPQRRVFASFTVREGERELAFVSRPGVFCHGRLDAGTRALLAAASCQGATRVLDLGCGVGVLGIVAACRCPEARVTLVDSNGRAVQCAERNVAAHGLRHRCRVVLTAHPARDLEPAAHDLILTNPPYFGHHRVSERFLDAARTLLAAGGRLALVTKAEDWHREAMGKRFGAVRVERRGGYAILTATQEA